MPTKGHLAKRGKNFKEPSHMTLHEVRVMENALADELETNPMYSLEVDPEGKYSFGPVEREFIEHMVQYKNVKFVSVVLMDMDMKEGIEIYKSPNVQNEIRRINLAMYARRFCSKMADLDALGGYLTTALTDENVPAADRLSGKEKLAAVKLLIELNQLKGQAMENPEVIDYVDIEKEVRSLRVDEIQMLIENSSEDDKTADKKRDIIAKIDSDGLLSPEEVAYMRTLSIKELKKLARELGKGLEGIEDDED